MEAYERKTHEIVNGFIGNRSSYADCIAELDAALTSFLPRMVDGQVTQLRLMMLANITRVNFEMEKRGSA